MDGAVDCASNDDDAHGMDCVMQDWTVKVADFGSGALMDKLQGAQRAAEPVRSSSWLSRFGRQQSQEQEPTESMDSGLQEPLLAETRTDQGVRPL